MDKDKRIKLKKFDIDSKLAATVYLQELITRLDRLIYTYRSNYIKLEEHLETIKSKHPGKEDATIDVSKDIYSHYLSLLSGDSSYALNVIGDSQKASLSYFKFRLIIEKRIKKNTLDFKIRELTEEQRDLLNQANRSRNWSNHVPETLLTAQLEMIKENQLVPHSINPIIVHYDNFVTLEYMNDFYNECTNQLELYRKMHQSMKQDYSSLIGASVRVVRDHRDISTSVELLEATKLAHSISFPTKK